MPARQLLDPAPLVRALRLEKGPVSWRSFLGGTGPFRSLARAAKRGGIDPYFADRLCVKFLRCHPSAVFGEEWWGLRDPCARPNREKHYTCSRCTRPVTGRHRCVEEAA